MTDAPCPDCGHTLALGRCWRLTCRSNGARESAELARNGETYLGAKMASARAARRLMQSSMFDLDPPDKALAFVADDDGDDE